MEGEIHCNIHNTVRWFYSLYCITKTDEKSTGTILNDDRPCIFNYIFKT